MAARPVRIRLFAGLRQLAGRDEVSLEVGAGQSIEGCWQLLCRQFPGLESWRATVRPARNLGYAEWGEPVSPGDELAFLPPVSGGAATETPIIEVRVGPEPIDLGEMMRAVERRGLGAVATFDGLVRDPDLGVSVPTLEYEAYPEMAEPVLEAICLEACRRFGAGECRVQHRTGRVPSGVTSVAVVVGAGHRHQALDACAYVIDELKSRAPIWKSAG